MISVTMAGPTRSIHLRMTVGRTECSTAFRAKGSVGHTGRRWDCSGRPKRTSLAMQYSRKPTLDFLSRWRFSGSTITVSLWFYYSHLWDILNVSRKTTRRKGLPQRSLLDEPGSSYY